MTHSTHLWLRPLPLPLRDQRYLGGTGLVFRADGSNDSAQDQWEAAVEWWMLESWSVLDAIFLVAAAIRLNGHFMTRRRIMLLHRVRRGLRIPALDDSP